MRVRRSIATLSREGARLFSVLAERPMPDSGYVMETQQEPRGELASRVLAMPTDTNPKGDIFGGWIMSLMDMAGKIAATPVANPPRVTVAGAPPPFPRPVERGAG